MFREAVGETRIAKIENNNGIYPDRWGEYRPYHVSWKLVTSVDLGDFKKKGEALLEEWTKISSFCGECDQRLQLDEIGGLLRRTVQGKLERVKEILMDEDNHRERRKRAPFEFIGTINRALFGTLNADDARYYDEKLDQFEQDFREMAVLMENQTQLVRSELADIEADIGQIASRMNETSHMIVLKLAKVDQILLAERLRNRIGFVTLSLAQEVTVYATQIETLTEAILFAKEGQLHPELLAPRKIVESARTIQNVELGSEFPVPIEHVKCNSSWNM